MLNFFRQRFFQYQLASLLNSQYGPISRPWSGGGGAPTITYLIDEDFEGDVSAWTSNNANAILDYSDYWVPHGAKCARLDCRSSSYLFLTRSHTAKSELWYHATIAFNSAITATQNILRIRNPDGNTVFTVQLTSSGVTLESGSASDSASLSITPHMSYVFWIHANAATGDAELYIGTTNERPETATATITGGDTGYTTIGQLRLEATNSQTLQLIYIDTVKVADGEFTTVSYDPHFDISTATSNITVLNPAGRMIQQTADALTEITMSKTTHSSGKRYVEFVSRDYGNYRLVGFVEPSAMQAGERVGGDRGWGWMSEPRIYGSNDGTYTEPTTDARWSNVANAVLGLAIDIDAGKIWLSLGGTYWGSQDPETATSPAIEDADIVGATLAFATSLRYDGDIMKVLTKSSDMIHGPPTGFTVWDG